MGGKEIPSEGVLMTTSVTNSKGLGMAKAKYLGWWVRRGLGGERCV